MYDSIHCVAFRRKQVSEATALQVGEVLRLTDAQSAKVNLCDSGTKLWALYGALLANAGCELRRTVAR